MPKMTRRKVLQVMSAAVIGVAAGQADVIAKGSPSTNARFAFKHRVQFGAWINDMQNDVLPRDHWPARVWDDQTERDMIDS
jgi:hypothetical protein